MKIWKFQIVIFLFCISIFQARVLGNSADKTKQVFVVTDEIESNGVENGVQKFFWEPGLTVGDMIIATHRDSESVFVLISDSSAIVYRSNALGIMSAQNDLVSPGDVIVVGPVDPKRAEELDQIPEVRERLGVKWSEYKHWVRRARPTPKSSRSP
jgi:hypothetical protein